MRKNAKLVKGCNIIEFENKFIPILDEAYQSFLIGLYHSKIQFNGRELDYEQKKSLFEIPIMKLIDFLRKFRKINGQMQNDMQKLNSMRNKYVHPLLEGDLFEDATTSINILCKIIDAYVNLHSINL